MPRVIDLTATGYDSNGKQVAETGAAFPSKPSKQYLREYFTPRVASAAANANADVGSINMIEITGLSDNYTFEMEGGKKSTTHKRTTKPPKTEKTVNKRSTGSSKKDQAIELYKKNADKSRKEIIQLLVDQLDMTPAGAATYYSTAKKSVE